MTGSNVTYLRWRTSESRRATAFEPPADDHPLVTNQVPCLLCATLLAGQRIQLLVMGPEDEETQERHDAGRWYAALCVVAHERCLSLLSDDDLELLVAELEPERT